MPYSRQIIKGSIVALAIIALSLFGNLSFPKFAQNSSPTSKNLAVLQVERSYAVELGKATFVTDVFSGSEPGGQWVHNLYATCRNILNVILVVILLVIAFANILSINIETYAVKKLLPKLIIAAVIANLAMPLFTLASRLVDSLYALSFFAPRSFDWQYFFRASTVFQGGVPTTAWGTVAWIIVGSLNPLTVLAGLLLILAGSFVMLALAIIIWIRPYVIFLAAAVAPIAVALSIIPQTQGAFKKWLNIALVWMFLPLIVYFILYVGVVAVPSSTSILRGNPVSALVGFILPTLLRLGLLILAIRAPFAMEKDIMGAVQTAGKYIGKGAMTGSGKSADVAYLKAKALKMEHAGETEAALGKFTGAHDNKDEQAEFMKQKYEYLRNNDDRFKNRTVSDTEIEGELEDKEKNDWSNTDEAKQKRIEDYTKFKETNASAEYEKNIAPKVTRIERAGALLSLPFGFVEGRKLRMESDAKERVKSSQKILGKHLTVDVYNPLTGKTKAIGITSEMIRGKLADPKYAETIIESDLNRNVSVKDIQDYRKGERVEGAMEKDGKKVEMYEAAVQNAMKEYGLDHESAERTVASTLHGLNVADENIGVWRNQAILKGFNAWQVAVMKVTYKREAEQSLRQNQFGNGEARRREADRNAERVKFGGRVVSPELLATADKDAELLSRGARTPAGSGGNPEETPGREYPPISDEYVPADEHPGHAYQDALEEEERAQAGGGGGADTEENPMIEGYLAQIASQTKGLEGGLGKVSTAIKSAQGMGLSDLNSQPIAEQSDQVTDQLGLQLQNIGFSPMSTRRFVTALKASNALAPEDPSIIQLKQEANQDPEVGRLLDEHTALQTGYIGALANSEYAMSVQRQVGISGSRLVADPGKIPEVQGACNVILNYKMEPGTIAPADYNKAIEAVKPYLAAGTIAQTTDPSGQISLDVEEKTIEGLNRSIEAMTVTNPQGQRVITTDPVTIQVRTALQVKRDVEISELGALSSEIKTSAGARVGQGQAALTDSDQGALNKAIAKFAGTHFNLQSGNKWQQSSPEVKDAVIEGAKAKILDNISKSADPNRSVIKNAATFLFDEFNKALPNAPQ